MSESWHQMVYTKTEDVTLELPGGQLVDAKAKTWGVLCGIELFQGINLTRKEWHEITCEACLAKMKEEET
jgi:hypothetical protein